MDLQAIAATVRERLAAGDSAGAVAVLPAHKAPDALATLAGQAHWSDGRYAEALTLFARGARAAPTDPDAALREAQALVLLDRRPEALSRARSALSGLAASPGLELITAQLRLDGEPAADLLPLFAALNARYPGFGEAEVALACLRLLLGQLPAQPRSFGRAMADARWASALVQRQHLPPARLLGTSTAVLEAARRACRVEGLVLEFGVYHGRSLGLLEPGSDGCVHGFDSFEGLPSDWTARDPRGGLSTGGRLPNLPAPVRLHRGWFEHSLPAFLEAHPGSVRLAHIDCDLYASTITVLEALAPRLVSGSVLVFDDFLGYPGWEAHEYRAWHEFAQQRALEHEWLGMSLIGREVALILR